MKEGFTLIELMVVILLIGIITAIGIPRFLRSPVPESERFISQLNLLISDGVLSARQSGSARKVMFNLLAKQVEIQSLKGAEEGKPLVIPEVVEVTDVIINGKSQFMGGGEKRTVYFLINPEGLSQEVRMIVVDKNISGQGRGKGEFEFYLNPFRSIFRRA